MTVASLITVAANACAIVVYCLLLLGAMVMRGAAARINRAFIMMLIGCVIGGGTEFVYPWLADMPGAAMHVLRDSIVQMDHFAASFVFVSFVMYLRSFLLARGRVDNRPFILVFVIYAMQIPVFVAAALHHIFDVQGWVLVLTALQTRITAVISALGLLIVLAVVLANVKSHNIKKREWISMFLYVMVTILAVLPGYFYEGLQVAWLGTAVGAFIIFILIHIEVQTTLMEKELELTESRVAIMLTQIKPHFLYNTLSAIEYFCDAEGADKSSGIVRDFAEYLKGNMNSLAQKKPIPFERELQHTRLYLSIEQLQYEERLKVSTDIQATAFTIPALTLQPIVENAVKHGVSKREQGGKVTIETRETDESYLVVVKDDGVGFNPEHLTGKNIGISNVRYRLKSMCGGSLTIDSVPGAGTTAIITIPKGYNIIAVDDKRPVLLGVEKAILIASPDCTLAGFTSAREALEYTRTVRVDVGFLDIDMAEMNGLILAKALKEIRGETNIVFVTGYADYALDAFDMAASGYILKPVSADAVSREMHRLRNPVIEPAARISIKCFGNFSISVYGEPLIITRKKPKELLAYLVHKRGSFARSAELTAILWEDKAGTTAIKANLRQVVYRLTAILREAGIEDILIRKWDQMAIDISKVSCDYYDYLERKTTGVNAYAGEYLSEYSWAEFVINSLQVTT